MTRTVCLLAGLLAIGGSTAAAADVPLRASLVLPANARQAMPAISGRLTPPRTVKMATRVAFADENGGIAFDKVRNGRYLFEIHAGEKVLYQKVIDLQKPMYLRVDATGAAVTEVTPLTSVLAITQERQVALGGPLGGRVAIYVADIHSPEPYNVAIYRAGREQAMWRRDQKLSLPNVLRAVQKPLLFNRTVSVRNWDAPFEFEGTQYVAVVLPYNRSGILTDDSADIFVFRAAQRP